MLGSKFMFAKNKLLISIALLFILLPFAAWRMGQDPFFIDNNKDFTVTVLNGFWTALFALLFLGISTIMNKITTRERQHYNALVNLGTQLNEMIGVIKDNLYVIEGFREGIVKANIFWGNLRSIQVDKSHLENLYDIDLINKVFSFYYQVRKINDDMENLQNGYNDLKNAYIQKYIKVDQYVENAERISEKLQELALFNEQLLEDLLVLFARVRIQVEKDKPFTSWVLEKVIYISGPLITVKELDNEVTKLEDELDDTSRISSRQIEKVAKKKR